MTEKMRISAIALVVLKIAVPNAKGNPNVIVVMTDQQRADLCKREGFSLDVMPFADSLAATNVWFDRAYTSAPASVPARTSLMTGRFPKATHVRTNHNIADAYFLKDLPSVMHESSNVTAMIGKNHTYLTPKDMDYWNPYSHNGNARKDVPGSREFSEFAKKTTGFYLEPSPVGVEHQQPYQIVSDALDWIEQHKDTSFFAWISIPEPHNPYQVPEPYYSMFPPESLPPNEVADVHDKDEKYQILFYLEELAGLNNPDILPRLRSNYLGMLRLIDDQMRRLVSGLKRMGVYENTIIVYLSDHGDYVGEYGLMRKGAGVPDVLMRIPMIWTGPGIVDNYGRSAAHVSIVDVFPTICEAIGVEIPEGVQGRSLWPILTGEKFPESEFDSIIAEQGFGGADYPLDSDLTFEEEGCLSRKRTGAMDELNTWTQSGARRMLRMGRWKLVVDNYGNCMLYDVEKDPYEVDDLSQKRRFCELKNQMLIKMTAWEIRTQDPLPLPPRRYKFKTELHNYLWLSE